MNLDTKHWRPSPVYPEHYFVSDSGEVYSVRLGKLLKPHYNAKGYCRYTLFADGKKCNVRAHRLVALAFIPNVEGKPQVDHINGNRKDNRVCNLAWVNNRENCANPLTRQRVLAAARKRRKVKTAF